MPGRRNTMNTPKLLEKSDCGVKFKTKDGALVPFTPSEETRPFLERAAEALGVRDRDGAVLLMSQIPGASYKFSPENEALINGVIATVQEINPRDPVESMLAAQMVTCHTKAMRLMERVTSEELTPELREKYLRLADRLVRTYSRQVEVLASYRRKGKQSMVVKHVTVKDGGQAIVGNIGKRGDQ
jgi:hypothetical protein